METSKDGRLARGESRQLLIMDAAVRVVAEHGSGALTHRAAASEAGVSLASVTYHYPSISALRGAMFLHAGSRIGFAFRALIEDSVPTISELPAAAAEFVASLVSAQRLDTVAVFEMILAASHDPELRPLARFLDDRLTEILTPYVGSQVSARVLASSIQGLILSAVAQSSPSGELRVATLELIERFARDDAASVNPANNGVGS
jgi:DNA-binding transcriptional regulator YbjK